MTNELATTRQTGFIVSLLAERDVPSDLRTAATASVNPMTKREASQIITSLMSCAKAVKAVTAMDALKAELRSAMTAIPTGKYALPVEDLVLLPSIKTSGDLLFLEISEPRKGYRKFARLSGAPGGFSRWRVGSVEDQIVLLQLIAQSPLQHSQRFGKHYTCCGRCAAELTDPESRRLYLGPTCRKVWGL